MNSVQRREADTQINRRTNIFDLVVGTRAQTIGAARIGVAARVRTLLQEIWDFFDEKFDQQSLILRF